MSRLVLRVAVALMCASTLANAVQAATTQDDELLVDPTVPLSLTYAPEAGEEGGGLFGFLNTVTTSYTLNSVLIRPGDRFAVINGERVRIGDSVGAARVTQIESDHVVLNVNGRIDRLELYGASIKTLVKGDE